jgi:hypothetical protein
MIDRISLVIAQDGGASYASSMFPDETYVGLLLPVPEALALFALPGLSAPGELMMIMDDDTVSGVDCEQWYAVWPNLDRR